MLEDAGNTGLFDPGEGIQGVPDLVGTPVAAEKRVISISIAGDQEQECSFWMGLFKSGDLTPNDIYSFKSVEDIFQGVASQGLRTAAEPLMITDTSVNPARFVYLVPALNQNEVLSEDNIEHLARTLRSWAPETVGLCLSPELCGQDIATELLQKMLRRLIHETEIKRYFLMVGKLGTNQLLNAALKLKFDVESDDLSVMIFH